MKTRILFIVVCLYMGAHCVANAQYNPQKKDLYKSDTIYMENYAYVCDTLHGWVNVHNMTNSVDKGFVCYADSGKIPDGDLFDFGAPEYVKVPLEQQRNMVSIVDNAFTIEQANLVGEEEFFVILYISTTTGEITDVYFEYDTDSGFTSIPMSVFRAIELQLKEQIVFELTEEGRKMNYCYLAWTQCPTGYVAPTLDPDMPFDGSGGGGEGNVQMGPRGSIATEPMRIEK